MTTRPVPKAKAMALHAMGEARAPAALRSSAALVRPATPAESLVVAPNGHPRRRPGESSTLPLGGLFSLGLHAALLVVLLLWFRAPPSSNNAPDAMGAVELVLVDNKGAAAPAAAQQSRAMAAPAPQAVRAPSATGAPESFKTDAELTLPPPPPPLAELSVPPAPNAMPPAPRAATAPTISLEGDSYTNAIATGPDVIPASVDAQYHNRKPDYPSEAARRSEQGAVVLLIHVSPQGLARGVDVEESSGFVLLDQAARDAVLSWRFLPAVKDGQPIPFDMPFRVVFQLD